MDDAVTRPNDRATLATSGSHQEHTLENIPLLSHQGMGDDDDEGDSSAPPNTFSIESRKPSPSGTANDPVIQVDRGSSDTTATDCELRETREGPSPSTGSVSRASVRLIVGVILLQYFVRIPPYLLGDLHTGLPRVAFVDQSLMHTIHPVITSEFHSSNLAPWLETAFLLTSTTCQPLAARISDNIGRRLPQLFSLFIFAVATAWCAVVRNMRSLILARALCGIGAGGFLAMSPVIMNDVIPISVRGTYQGYINLSVGIASAWGAAFGGWVCDHLGWRWAFGIQVPLIVFIFAVAFATTPSILGPHLVKNQHQGFAWFAEGLDSTGSLLLCLSVASLLLGLNLGGNALPWSHPAIILLFALSTIISLVFIFFERRAQYPVMPLKMLSSPPAVYLVFSNFLAYMGYNALFFNAPILFQVVKLESATVSGLRLAVPNFAVTVFGLLSGVLITRTGRMKWLILTGSSATVLGSALMSSIWVAIPNWMATIFLIPASLGMGLNTPATSIAVLAISSYQDQAVMTTTLTVWRKLGAVMGIAISSFILQHVLRNGLEHRVTGAHKAEIIDSIRKSMRAIFHLSPKHQAEGTGITIVSPLLSLSLLGLMEQVILAYQTSLQATFGFAIVVFAASLLLVLPAKLPSLRALGKRV